MEENKHNTPHMGHSFRTNSMKLKPTVAVVFLFVIIIPAAFSVSNESDGGAPIEPSCFDCASEERQFLYAHNAVRGRKAEAPLEWDPQLRNYAVWWAQQRRRDCELLHSFKDGEFTLGENIFWGGGGDWTAEDAVSSWAEEERYYRYWDNSCMYGQECGHYTQIVWKTTRRIGCARVLCDAGDVFVTCNYYPPGNYVGERPY